MKKPDFLRVEDYKGTIAKQDETIKNLAKSVAEGCCENARLRAKIVVLESGKGE